MLGPLEALVDGTRVKRGGSRPRAVLVLFAHSRAMSCALLGVLLFGGLAGAAPHSFPPPGRIVFSKQIGDETRALFVGRSDGSEAVQITAGPNDYNAQWLNSIMTFTAAKKNSVPTIQSRSNSMPARSRDAVTETRSSVTQSAALAAGPSAIESAPRVADSEIRTRMITSMLLPSG